MADIIKLLPDSVANQIAAGEVIQRPASVVKELVENSVDAGAGIIKVIIKDAGKTLIQVIDDGTGMSETDARLAFERHATSKITTANDLFAITTKGFRGEALASIAAVAMVELRTRRREDEAGTLIVINGSKVEAQEICSCPPGSSLSVKSLFFNIPARRKFLKSDNTEIRHIIGEFQKVALAHPAIKFSLYHNDTEIYNLPEGNLRQRVIGVFGKPIGQDLINLDTSTTIIKIAGFIGKPENARRSSGEQFFFVNSRFMKHPYFHKALMEAYQNILPPDTIPSYFIFLEVDPARIDINIHPTKTEVKFEDERAIWQIIMASSREALGRFNISPSIDFENEALIDIPVMTSGRSGFPDPPKIEINPGYNPFAGDDYYNKGNIVERFEKAKIQNWEKLYPPDQGTGSLPDPENNTEDISRKIFQIKERYLVAPVRSGLMIIDQKRAHERVLYEKYLDMLTRSVSVESQTSMFPETLELTPGDYYILGEIRDELEKCGFEIQELGNNVVSLNTFPASMKDMKPAALLESIIREYREKQADPAIGITAKVALSLSRSAAIPYGRRLSRSEMEDLFDSLFACSSPNYSPAGKPIISIITLEEIDRRLK
jgi:DNA mismatch repair protein MutL